VSGARLLTEQQGRVLVVQFTNPPRNFFDEQMAIELRALVREIDKDSSLGAVIFTGKDLFVTHYEVPDLLRGARGTPFKMSYRQARALGAYVRFLERAGWLHGLLRRTPMRDALTGAQTYRTLRRMNASDKVFIAAINGVALGMGAILALACDLRLMADGEDAAFGLIEQGISILAANGGTQRLVRMVGQSRAAELLLEGRFLSPAEAEAIGLANRVVPRQDLQAEALALAHRLASRSPELNQEIKRMIHDAGSKPFARATRMEFGSAIRTLSTDRATEDMETYAAELAKHDSPTDRQVLDAWEKMLATGPSPADVPREHHEPTAPDAT
jgi:enoyl-CoA hydratase